MQQPDTPSPDRPATDHATRDIPAPAPAPGAGTADPNAERDALLEAQRQAHRDSPRNLKDDALHDKVVSVEPDATGPTPTETFDPPADRHAQ